MKTKGKGRGIKKAKSERVRTSFKRAYLSKAQAARRLQITNAEFERLVILKGVYPREPKRFDGSQGKDKSYYFTKDILWLEREPMLQRLRDFGTFKKKLARLKGRREHFDAKKFDENHRPQYNLSAMIKERYPTFADALRDCDDALTHIFLYAALPPRIHSDSTIEGHTYLTSGMADQCREVRDRWLKYIASTKGMTKAFISIKGIYYQAKVQGETVTWQTPYEFTSNPPGDVVYRVLISFLEFYLQQMRFILFKLEHDQKLEQERAANEDDEAVVAENFPMSDADERRKEKAEKLQGLFKGLTFYVSRENPKMHLNFIIESFSGKLAKEPKAGITHYLIDRPSPPPGEKKLTGVDYIQPQWLFDCINAKGLLPVDEYLLGKALPPHVSPFRISISNDPDETAELERAIAVDRRILEGDVPDRVHQIRRMLDPAYNVANPSADVHLSDEDDDDLDEDDQRAIADADVSDDESVSSDASTENEVKENIERSKLSKKKLAKQLETGDNKPSDTGRVAAKRKRLAEIREERDTEDTQARKKRKLEETEAKAQADKELKMSVMETKKRKLLKAMEFGIKNRKKQMTELEERRQAIRDGDATVEKTKKGSTIKMKKKK